MAKPLYYRSSNPGLPGVTAKSNKLFEWDGTGSTPPEIANGKAFMPTEPISGEYLIMSDTYTLGYTNEADAAPIFFSDGGAGDAKILEIINSVANRLGVAHFTDIVAAKAWAASALQIAIGGGSTGSGSTGSGSTTKAYDLDIIANIQYDTWTNGMVNYMAPGPAAPWAAATSIPVNIYDSNGNNRQTELLGASSRIAFYVDASNYVVFDVTSTVLNTFNGYDAQYNSDPSIVNTVVVFSVTNMVAEGQRPANGSAQVTILIDSEVDDVIGVASAPISNAYFLNTEQNSSGQIVYNPGQIIGLGGSPSAPSSWPNAPSIQIARYDAFGNDRLNDFNTATTLRIEVDASNYVEYAVVFNYVTNLLFVNGSHEHLRFTTTSKIASAGQNPQKLSYTVDPGYVTVS